MAVQYGSEHKDGDTNPACGWLMTVVRLCFTLLLLLVTVVAVAHFAKGAWQHLILEWFADTPIFVDSARQFLRTGVLYDRSLPLERTYAIGAGVFKFPPVYLLDYLPFINSTAEAVPANFYTAICALHVLRYMAVAVLCGFLLGPRRNLHWWLVCITVSCFFSPFYESLWGLTFDNLILLLMCIALLLAGTPLCKSGMLLISYLACSKIYPVTQLLYYTRGHTVREYLLWMVLPVLVIMIMTVAIFGVENTMFYYGKVLPVLLREEISGGANNMSLIVRWSQGTGLPLWVFQGLLLLASAGILRHVCWRKQDVHQARLLFVCLLPLQLLLLKNCWGNYQMLLLLPVVFLLGRSFDGDCRHPWLYRLVALVSAVPQMASINYTVLNMPYIDYLMLHYREEYLSMIAWRHYSPLLLWAGGCLLLLLETHKIHCGEHQYE